MAYVLNFDDFRKSAAVKCRAADMPDSSAEIVLFTGVRYERVDQLTSTVEADDPAPTSVKRRKRR